MQFVRLLFSAWNCPVSKISLPTQWFCLIGKEGRDNFSSNLSTALNNTYWSCNFNNFYALINYSSWPVNMPEISDQFLYRGNLTDFKQLPVSNGQICEILITSFTITYRVHKHLLVFGSTAQLWWGPSDWLVVSSIDAYLSFVDTTEWQLDYRLSQYLKKDKIKRCIKATFCISEHVWNVAHFSSCNDPLLVI